MTFSVAGARLLRGVASAIALASVLTGCSAAEENATPTPVAFKACMVATSAGFNDGGFNQLAYFGLQQAMVEYGPSISVLATQSDNVYSVTSAAKKLVSRGCNLVIANGTKAYSALLPLADGNPALHFVALGYNTNVGSMEPTPINNNLTAIAFDGRSAFLQAGYLAAAASNSGRVGVIGASGNPVVQTEIWYFRQGVMQYSQRTGKSVSIFGAQQADPSSWDLVPAYTSATLLKSKTRAIIGSGADVIFPVGLNGLPVAQAASDLGAKVIGSDSEWVSQARYATVKSAILASVVKNIASEVAVSVAALIPGNPDPGALASSPTVSIGETDGERWPDGAAEAMNSLASDYAAGKSTVIDEAQRY